MAQRQLIFMLAALLAALSPAGICAKENAERAEVGRRLSDYFADYKPKGQELPREVKVVDWRVDDARRAVVITVDDWFADQEFTHKSVAGIYKKVRKLFPKAQREYVFTIMAAGMSIDDLVPNRIARGADKTRLWGDVDYDGAPWVRNASEPMEITHGLQNRHISLWASHGLFFDHKKGLWRWQRPKLFGTTEDLFTPTIVVPYLIPMLENAGANVFTPRERDGQRHEVIVDNDDDDPGTSFLEVSVGKEWRDAGVRGFALRQGSYADGENPFEAGTARAAEATKSKKRHSLVSYQPNIPREGRYAVYVSYATLPGSVDDALYTVWHKGERTEFRVNQRMGGGTWVYLGTFAFDKGSSEYNRVTITNQSRRKGVVTTDAVRFGGGMGNIERGGQTSGAPRCLEGARYYAQWAGMPYSVYSTKNGADDYSDDINVRSLMTNYVGGGSPYMPSLPGLKVPIELSLAIHSDAGYDPDGRGLIGSLAICTTNFNGGRLNAGISRLASRDLADALLANTARDLKYRYGRWAARKVLDRNYSETRLPEVPSAILETMSHQSFPDMRLGQDPNVKFTLARSIYKTILRYICDQHDRPYVVAPLAPANVRMRLDGETLRLEWDAVADPQEATSRPSGYVVYTAVGSADFDNGVRVGSSASYKVSLEPNVLYRFRVAAINRGGKSFPSETVCALYNPHAAKSVMIVDGFQRLSSPAVVDNAEEQGFLFDEDPGVTLGPTLGWVGRQTCFRRSAMGVESEDGLGWSNDDFAGTPIAGNNQDHSVAHAEAIASARRYNILTCTASAVENGQVDLSQHQLVDLVLGLEKDDGHSLVAYKTFTKPMQAQLRRYAAQGGSILASGAYIASDMGGGEEKAFLEDVLKCRLAGNYSAPADTIAGLGTTFTYHNAINPSHYAATRADALLPAAGAFEAMTFADGQGSATAYRGPDRRAFAMGFPFECIRGAETRAYIMRGLLNFLLE